MTFGDIELLNVDCLKYMATVPDKFFELAIVDPPYGIGNCINTHGKKRYKKMQWNNASPGAEYFNELYRISINQIIWGANYYTGFIRHSGVIVHDKSGNGQFIGPATLSDGDIASHSFNNLIKIFRYGWSGNRMGTEINWDNSGPDARIHPTQKPVALYKWLLKNYAKEGDKIFDSHGGSMSIAIACADYGFPLTLCELDKDYYDAGVKRFKNHIAQQKLFV